MGDARPALDVHVPSRSPDLTSFIDALLDDFRPFAIEDIDGATRRIHFFSREDRDDASRAIEHRFGSTGVRPTSVEIADDNWAARSQETLRAIRVGTIVVAPPWDIPNDIASSAVVVIRPSMGFGTGHHASTRLCLRGLQSLSVARRTVLDVGTGSGVLAIAAAKLDAASVRGIDTDRDAVDTARENVGLNGVKDRVEIHHADFRDARQLGIDGKTPAAVVLANINATLALDHTETLVHRVAERGVLVVGGITAPEEASVRLALDPFGQIVARYAEDEWIALVLERVRPD